MENREKIWLLHNVYIYYIIIRSSSSLSSFYDEWTKGIYYYIIILWCFGYTIISSAAAQVVRDECRSIIFRRRQRHRLRCSIILGYQNEKKKVLHAEVTRKLYRYPRGNNPLNCSGRRNRYNRYYIGILQLYNNI